ncbi:MAG: polysaccharide deacetylase family protein [Candidatus Pelagadaptatus aseana]|uniref:polysaccharide deacetylase family protein n=1 Tax=Candidatus Pelagadaptatus aseana TaxID=3120508 RepID=UPI0039B179C1
MIKRVVCCLLLAGSVLSLPLRAAVILQYHHVGSGYPDATSVSVERFRQHMDYLHEQQFSVVSLVSLVDAIKQGRTLPEKAVVITFDDAYESVLLHATPILQDRGWPYTVFASTEAVDKGYQGVMSWEQLREISRRGADIANHTVSHSHLIRQYPEESEDNWQERVGLEIDRAEQRIQDEVGHSHKLLAFPYGEYNLALLQLMASRGFAGVGQQSGALGDWMDVRLLPRFPFAGAYGDLQDFAIKVNSLPLPVASVAFQGESYSHWVEPVLSGPSRPVLKIKFGSERLDGLRCYATGQGQIDVDIVGSEARVTASAALLPGRSRYNCTAAGPQGRFYWFSQLFIIPQKDGSWYPEP